MNQGTIEQIGTPEEIYRRPTSPYVADFVGAMNFLPGSIADDGQSIQMGDLTLTCSESHQIARGYTVTVALRPEDIRIDVRQQNGNNNVARALVSEAEFLGAFYRLTLQLEGYADKPLIAEVSNNAMRDMSIQVGSTVFVHLPANLLRVYPGKVGIRT